MRILFITLLAISSVCTSAQTDTLYQTNNLLILEIQPDVYQHVSYLNTQSFGRVACNGMVYGVRGEALVFDTPVDSMASAELLGWIRSRNLKAVGVVVNHHHNDCLGGLEVFHGLNIPSYASHKTIALAQAANSSVPTIGFADSLILSVGGQKVINRFFGPAHALGNIVSYVPAASTLFGGCMIKSLGAGKGYIGEADVDAWPKTATRILDTWPAVRQVIPGHGSSGGTELVDYTIKLFSQ